MTHLYLIRHGSTDWSDDGRHTGRTDLPLNASGRRQAATVADQLAGQHFELVLVSPLQRARQTCEIAGLEDQATIDEDLHEWDYGDYEGLTTPQIRESVPGWTVWTGPVPGGESIDQVSARADRVIGRALEVQGDVALFAHSHILRVLTARWCDLDPTEGRRFPIDTASVCRLGWEHEYRTVRRWNGRA